VDKALFRPLQEPANLKSARAPILLQPAGRGRCSVEHFFCSPAVICNTNSRTRREKAAILLKCHDAKLTPYSISTTRPSLSVTR
jgi:hypothetical protein